MTFGGGKIAVRPGRR